MGLRGGGARSKQGGANKNLKNKICEKTKLPLLSYYKSLILKLETLKSYLPHAAHTTPKILKPNFSLSLSLLRRLALSLPKIPRLEIFFSSPYCTAPLFLNHHNLSLSSSPLLSPTLTSQSPISVSTWSRKRERTGVAKWGDRIGKSQNKEMSEGDGRKKTWEGEDLSRRCAVVAVSVGVRW